MSWLLHCIGVVPCAQNLSLLSPSSPPSVLESNPLSLSLTPHPPQTLTLDVRRLRGGQFAEDSGPMAHPIRPESYISMDNFYTGTVYVKGAEVSIGLTLNDVALNRTVL
jgi:hypothetical protein